MFNKQSEVVVPNMDPGVILNYVPNMDPGVILNYVPNMDRCVILNYTPPLCIGYSSNKPKRLHCQQTHC